MSLIAKAAALYRFAASQVGSWGERAVEEQDALDALRTSPGFHQLQDVLDGEERALFGKWRSLPDSDPAAILALHAEARAFNRLTRVIRQSTHAKQDAAQAEAEVARQMALRSVDTERNVDAAERLRMHTQRARSAAGVNR